MNIVFSLLLITILINLVLAIFIYFKNRKDKININFSLLVLSGAFWAFTNIMCLKAETIEDAILWSQISYLSAIFIGITFLYFSFVFPKKVSVSQKLKPKKYHKIFIILSIPLISVILFIPGFTVETVILYPWKIITGPGLYFFAIYFLGLMAWSFLNLIRKFFISQDKERIQLIYLFLGMFISGVVGIVLNLIFPLLLGDYRFVFLGPISALIMTIFTAYAIVKHQLFEIKVVMTSLFVALIATLLAVNFFVLTPPQLYLQILEGVALIIFLFFGYLLIKSVLQEIKRREQLEQLTAQLGAANIELKKLDKAKSEFISIASHQLRTPLTAIKGYISMIMEEVYGKLPEKSKKPMENIYQSNERLIKLVNDLLNLSRLEAGKIEFKPEPCSLEKIVQNIVDELKINAQKKGLKLKLKLSKNLPKILVDENKLKQVLLNIFDNAIKYTQKGEITIELEKIDNEQQIKISDTGEGMTENEIESIFQTFTRTTAGNQLNAEGAGIGLYVGKRFIEMHQGKIWAESPGKGKGTTFYVRLPSP